MKSPPMANEGLCGGAPPAPHPPASPLSSAALPAPSSCPCWALCRGALPLMGALRRSLLSLPPLLQVSDVPCTADLPRPQLK